VQGGSWHNAAPKLLASSAFGDMISTSALPRNWGGQNLLDDVVMTTQTRMLPNMVKVGRPYALTPCSTVARDWTQQTAALEVTRLRAAPIT
jgi:hypothetical protein